MQNNLLVLLLAACSFCSACGQNAEPAPSASPAPAAAQAPVRQARPSANYYQETARPADQIQKAYPFDIKLRTAAGDTLNSAATFAKNGRPTVLMFWLTTCGPCRLELNAINQKFEGWKQEADFNFYAVSTDFPKNYAAFVNRVQEAGWPFPAYHDLNREFRHVMPGELNGLPQVFVLDKNGQIAYHSRKYIPGDEDKLFAEVKKLL
jgi:thiol-disulfide isomerase/thioredoxin